MSVDTNHILNGKELVDAAVSLALTKKAENIVLLNPGNQSGIAEWFCICHGKNEIHNRAIADGILIGLKEQHNPPWHTEGINEGRWILLDYSDVVINILLPELREYYSLENLWEDCPRIDIQD